MLPPGLPTSSASGVVHNALARYHEHIRAAARAVLAMRSDDLAIPLEPAETFPELTAVTDIGLEQIDQRTYLLDLMRNPGARTTKTMASLLMVSRAISHIRRTGERVLVLTPTSGNKGTALRDAIARAYATGLTTPQQLRMAMVVPEQSRAKLRACPLTDDTSLHSANPVAVAEVRDPADVKELCASVAASESQNLLDTKGFRIWYTLDLDNYRIADSARAFAEAELLPIGADSGPRLHAHAVSSAYGLLGYQLGVRVLADGAGGLTAPARHAGLFLVQQLATPDMVTSLLGTKVPEYEYDPTTGYWRQESLPEFPATTDDPAETIDATFYTKAPATSIQINRIVAQHGGGGVVVSKRECLERFETVRGLAMNAGIAIDPNPERIREWSLVKVLTGVLVARERGLVAQHTDVVVHASGYYTDDLVPPLRDEHITRVRTAADVATLIWAAASA
ncbi:DUF6002 family protein [Amycolatopsis sp. H20-H5]|uniref:DUF6002 family protein n=1 Tax=Amycolatopsis sp. H20-H5 TaxID=3046309 RepID=UPI002DB7FDAB|nr:DUF6002 family protein [Amycolatopsis sp. H20-H5]MEC3977733.1 DUF6002 family protein [Amycolatopsis sp. H20-H5]